jgi:uncharacterized protein (DUF2062 family)
MPRKFFRRIMPPREYVQNHRFLRYLGDTLHDSNLWHINRHSAAKAVFIGLFCAFMPIPLQMLLAAVMAIGLRANLPVSLAVVWVSNPVTMAPMLYGAYRVGAVLMGSPPQALSLHMDIEGWLTEIAVIWQPLLLGSLVCGTLAGGIGYFLVKILWRIMVIRQWRKRGQERRAADRRQTNSHSPVRSRANRRQGDRRRSATANRVTAASGHGSADDAQSTSGQAATDNEHSS